MNREYVAEQRPTLDAIEAALGGEFTLGRAVVSRRELTFYDTFDGLLRRAGIELALGDGEPVPEEAAQAAGSRALLALARVTVQSHAVALLDELDKTVVRLELLAADGLETRVTLQGLRGYEQELEQAAELLAEPLGLVSPQFSLRDTAILAAGGRPEGISAKVSVELDRDERADVAAVRVLRALWEVVDANLEGTIAGTDDEFLHDYRVSVRKIRSVLKEFKGIFPRAALDHWRAEFKWLQQVTGETRDLDVYLEDFDELAAMVSDADREALGPLVSVLRHRRGVARRQMVRDLRSDRAQALARDWVAFLAGLSDLPEGERPDASRSIDAVAGERIAKVYRRMVKMGEAIDPDSPAEEYHELRKQGKELRYLLELFGTPLHDAEVVKPMVKTLKSLQDVLGRHQDREVQAGTVRSLADDVASLPGGPEALIAMGALVRALGADERDARGEFTDAFAAFASKQQHRLVKDTFKR